jgi:antitoxin MazE
MQTALRKMGNSVGMIVPKAILQELGVTAGTAIEIRVEEGGFMSTLVRHPRAGWAEDAERIGALPLTEEEQDWMAFGNEGDDGLRW